jgi:hypothetical protein
MLSVMLLLLEEDKAMPSPLFDTVLPEMTLLFESLKEI